MSEEINDRPRELNRREFLALLAAVLATGGYAMPAWAQTQRTFTHEGRRVSLQERDGELELYIDGKPVVTVDSNGVYRAANFMYSPQLTLEELAKSIIDHRAVPAGG
jgi:hypothetical protein